MIAIFIIAGLFANATS